MYLNPKKVAEADVLMKVMAFDVVKDREISKIIDEKYDCMQLL